MCLNGVVSQIITKDKNQNIPTVPTTNHQPLQPTTTPFVASRNAYPTTETNEAYKATSISPTLNPGIQNILNNINQAYSYNKMKDNYEELGKKSPYYLSFNFGKLTTPTLEQIMNPNVQLSKPRNLDAEAGDTITHIGSGLFGLLSKIKKGGGKL